MTRTVLVIDDDPAVRDAYCLALEDLPVHVVTAEDGDIGVQLAKECNPFLIFLDLKMPRMNGVEVLEQLDALSIQAAVYVITAFSSEYTSGLRTIVERGIAFELATKPITASQIEEIARSYLTDATEQPEVAEETSNKVVLKFFVAAVNDSVVQLVRELEDALKQCGIQDYELEMIDVVSMPEKALHYDIFATPTLIREFPEPLLKFIANVASRKDIMMMIKKVSPDGRGVVV